jgi:peptide/nickel transport system permease protein
VIAGDSPPAPRSPRSAKSWVLDRPIVTQFFIWFGNVLQGNFGESFFYKKTVASLIATGSSRRWRWRADHRAGHADRGAAGHAGRVPPGLVDRPAVMGFSVMGFSVPVFVIGYC